MPQSYTNLVHHMLWSTKHRKRMLPKELRERTFAYIGGICRNIRADLLSAGGYDDHIHVLVRLHPETSVSEAARTIKANSSRWLRVEVKGMREFRWQSAYTAFTVSQSVMPALREYFAGQEEHHMKVGILEELDGFLKKHGMERRRDEDDE